MIKFHIEIDNGLRKQVFTQEYANADYARMSLFHCMSDMLDSAIKEGFVGKAKEYEEVAQKFPHIPEICPECDANFEGAEIPVDKRANYGGLAHFSRAISLYSRGADRTMGWKCPDCGHEWPTHGPVDKPENPDINSPV